MSNSRTVVIVGGVAGGASCAARLRRQDEQVRIIMVERGPYVSYANCGLPYYVGGVIREEEKLLVATAELFRDRFRVEVRTGEEVVAIDRQAKQVEIHRLADGHRYAQPYDTLVLSPGARPVRPPLPGIDLGGIFSLRTVPDSRQVRGWIHDHQVGEAVVVGGGLIGLEMAENLIRRGIRVTLVERDVQVAPPLDPEMAVPVQQRLEKKGVTVALGEAVSTFEEASGRLVVHTASGRRIDTDMVILAIGVRPESELARGCGLEVAASGHIVVDDHLRTRDPAILAIGDAVEIRCAITGRRATLPLAGPANRQGRIAADVIAGRARPFRGVQGTAVCGLLGLTFACTGLNERAAQAAGLDYQVAYSHASHHVGYYPGSRSIYLKLLFEPGDGRVLGAQAIGEQGVARRIDVIAMAIQMGATVFDLEEAELCYAPQYGAAKDPVNVIGMIGANVVRGDLGITPWQEMGADDAFVLDVRDAKEVTERPMNGVVQIPLNELRDRLHELPANRPIQVSCAVGRRAYNATRLLNQHGHRATLLSGGVETWTNWVAAHREAEV